MSLLVFLSYLFTPFIRLLFLTKVTGKANFPATDGPLILCVNHISNCDVFILNTTYQKNFRYMAKKSLLDVPILSFFVKKFRIIPVDRDSRDVNSIMTAITSIKQGDPVVIFPQGKRYMDAPPQPSQAKRGVGMMIAATNAVVLPVGLYTKHYRARIFRRYHVNVGTPITPDMYKPVLQNGDKAGRFDRLTEFVFSRVCELAVE